MKCIILFGIICLVQSSCAGPTGAPVKIPWTKLMKDMKVPPSTTPPTTSTVQPSTDPENDGIVFPEALFDSFLRQLSEKVSSMVPQDPAAFSGNPVAQIIEYVKKTSIGSGKDMGETTTASPPKEESEPLYNMVAPSYNVDGWYGWSKRDTALDAGASGINNPGDSSPDWTGVTPVPPVWPVVTPAPSTVAYPPPMTLPAFAPAPVVPIPFSFPFSSMLGPFIGTKIQQKMLAQAQMDATLAALNITTTPKPVKLQLKLVLPPGGSLASIQSALSTLPVESYSMSM